MTIRMPILRPFLFLAVFCAIQSFGVYAAPKEEAPKAKSDAPDVYADFHKEKYRNPIELVEKEKDPFYDPFQLVGSSTISTLLQKDAPTVKGVSASEVAKAIGLRKIQGVYLDNQGRGVKIMIGDEIFGPETKIEFEDKGEMVPLIKDATIKIISIDEHVLVVDLSAIGRKSEVIRVLIPEFFSK